MSWLSFFAAHSFLTDPGRHAAQLEAAPGDLAGLSRMVQGLLLHIFWAERYGVRLAEARQGEPAEQGGEGEIRAGPGPSGTGPRGRRAPPPAGRRAGRDR